MHRGYHVFKRAADILLSGAGLIVFSPLLALIALKVKKKLGSPVIFSQQRPGLGGKIFRLYKFRSMKDRRGADGRELPDEQRLTPFGRKLRSTSLDELPELWNVLRGDMSLVGPRPLLPEYLPLYSERQRRRHDVKPGITGLAQVMGRNALTWEQKFEFDVQYVEQECFSLDLKILWLTLRAVIRREGISAEGSATMPPFTGSQERRPAHDTE
jgi:sugar transferase EpsL